MLRPPFARGKRAAALEIGVGPARGSDGVTAGGFSSARDTYTIPAQRSMDPMSTKTERRQQTADAKKLNSGARADRGALETTLTPSFAGQNLEDG